MGEDMAYGKGKRRFSGWGLAAAVSGGLVAACTTGPVPDVAQAPGRSGQPVDTGAYPNLNVPQKAATSQLTEEETQAKLARLNALQHRQAGTRPSATSEAERKRLKLAADEQEETLRVIEGE
jgi:hypothetical protein